MDHDSRAAKLAATDDPITLNGLEPTAAAARDLRLHPHDRLWSGPSMTQAPLEPHYPHHASSSGSHDHPARDDEIPIVFSANSAGAFIPSIVDAPAYEDDHFAQLSAAVKQKSEQLVADENEKQRGSEQLVPESYDAVNNTGITSSSSSSPPPTRFRLPLITAVPQSDSAPQPSSEWAGGSSRPQGNTMLFGEFSKSSSAANRRRMATSTALTEYEADLTSKDRLKQKEAIRRLLAGKVKDNWEWTWPSDSRPTTPVFERPEGDSAEPDWQEREDWASDGSESGDEADMNGSGEKDAIIGNPFRFDNPDTVGNTIQRKAVDRKTRRRRRLQQEMLTNDGVACFTHRRNAWTRARHVRIPRHSQTNPTIPNSIPNSNPPPGSNAGLEDPDNDSWEYITEIPIASPILPPETPMRKGISEKAYATIYDKVITQSQTPFCPINLSVVVRSCVEGWKRDGEWPPKGQGDIVMGANGKKSMGSEAKRALLFAKKGTRLDTTPVEGAKDKGVIRRSLQRVFGVVHGRRNSEIVSANAVANAVAENGDVTKSKEEAGDMPFVGAPIL